jgi:hypothetical protein
MGRYYILHGGEVVEEPDYTKWAKWHEDSYRQVCRVATTQGQYGTVSTVFLGINMTLSKDQPPLLFETRVEGGWLDGQAERYSTLEQAKAGHQAWVTRVHQAEQNKLPPPGRVW